MGRDFLALTYNISWATQSNVVIGSEADFVQRCQERYKRGGLQCHDNALKEIKKLPTIDLMAIQEVNSNIETKLRRMCKNLHATKLTTVGRSNILTLWNPERFGKLVACVEFSLEKKTDRPGHVLLLDKKVIIINLHAPVPFYKRQVETHIRKAIQKNKQITEAMKDADCRIIALGDFNDHLSKIHAGSPLSLRFPRKTIRIKPCMTRKAMRKTMKSCCWHEPGHPNGNFIGTGDYIIVNERVKQRWMRVPPAFKKRGANNRLFSDHMPVLSKMYFK